MKKYVSVLMVFLAVLMFSGCPDPDPDPTPTPGPGTKTVVTLSVTSLSVEVQETKPITATTVPANTALTWTSSDETKATVASDGKVTGVAEGSATITAKAADGGQATCAVTVTPLVPSISLNKASLHLGPAGTETLIATVRPAGTAVAWSSSATSVATVSNAGAVTAATSPTAIGSATITAKVSDTLFATCTVSVIPASTVAVDGQTLVHNFPPLVGVEYFGADLGTTNSNGSYTFDSTANQYNGGGAQYSFPVPGQGDTWLISNYDIFEIHLLTISGSIDVIVKRPHQGGTGNSTDLMPYDSPSTASQYPTFNSATTDGKFTYKTVVVEGTGGESGNGIAFQRNGNNFKGPAVVAIEKVVFSKGTIHTISFEPGTYDDDGTPTAATFATAVDPVKIISGRTVNFGSGSYISYKMPAKPAKQDDHNVFKGWLQGTTAFNAGTPITTDITLTADWGEPEPPPDMTLNLNPSSWGTLPVQSDGLASGGVPWPSEYATTSFTDNKLTVTYSGMNRQRAIVPLTTAQMAAILDVDTSSVTFRVVGEQKKEDGTASPLTFRVHLGDPTLGGDWNSTNTGDVVELAGLVQNVGFTRRDTNFKWFMMQAMFNDGNNNDNMTMDFGKVIVTITSITVDIGDTTF
jgi:hypothetical protein